MVNNAIHWVLGGILLLAWWFVGNTEYYAVEGVIGDGYWLATIFTVALMKASGKSNA